MTNFDRIKEMEVEEFIDELFLNIPDENNTQFVFGSWRNKDDVKNWLNSEAETSSFFTEAMLKDCIQELENATRHIPIREIEFVIRCKNCKYYELLEHHDRYYCNELGGYVTENDYCSYGERRDEE